MQYVPGVCIHSGIRDIMKKIDSSDLTGLNESTLVYYAIKLISEIDRLTRSLIDLAVSEQPKVQSLIAELNSSLDKINSNLHHTEYFKGDTNSNDPFIHVLTNYRNSGMSVDDAINKLSHDMGTPRVLVKDIMDANKYPNINTESRSFSIGVESANRLNGSLDDLYSKMDKFRNSISNINDFIGGYLSISPLSVNDSNIELIKNKISQYMNKEIGSTEVLTNYNNYFWR